MSRHCYVESFVQQTAYTKRYYISLSQSAVVGGIFSGVYCMQQNESFVCRVVFCNLPFFSAWHIPPYTHTGKRECWKEMVWRGSFYSNPLHKPEVKACPLPVRFGIKCSNISLWIHLNLGRVRGQEKSEMLENFRWPLEFVHGTLRERSAQPRQTNGNKFSVYGHSDVLGDWP